MSPTSDPSYFPPQADGEGRCRWLLIRVQTRTQRLEPGTILKVTPITDEISLVTDQPIFRQAPTRSDETSGQGRNAWRVVERASSSLLEEVACTIPESVDVESTLLFRIPFTCRLATPVAKVKVSLEYDDSYSSTSDIPRSPKSPTAFPSSSEPSSLLLRGVHTVDLAAVLSIRSIARWYGTHGSRVIVRTTLASEAEWPVRLRSGGLIQAPNPGWRIIYDGGLTGTNQAHGVILFPGDTYTFVHQLEPIVHLDPEEDPQPKAPPSIRVRYTLLTEELMQQVAALLNPRLTEAGLGPHSLYILEHVRERILHFCDLGQAALTGRLDLGIIPREAFVSAFFHEAPETKGRILETLDTLLRDHPSIILEAIDYSEHGNNDAGGGGGGSEGSGINAKPQKMRERMVQERLELPEVPQCLTIIELRQCAQEEEEKGMGMGEKMAMMRKSKGPDRPLRMEQPAPFYLIIEQRKEDRSRDEDAPKEKVKLFVEVEEDREHWLVCGKKRMHLTLEVSSGQGYEKMMKETLEIL